MPQIVIKRKVSFDFLGDEYKDAYLCFRSIPLVDYEKILAELPQQNNRYNELVLSASQGELTDQEDAELQALRKAEDGNNKKYLQLVIKYLRQYFHSGKFPNDTTGELEAITSADDLDGLDQEAAIRCFQTIMGQQIDPKS